jgi:hypothetical protein
MVRKYTHEISENKERPIERKNLQIRTKNVKQRGQFRKKTQPFL